MPPARGATSPSDLLRRAVAVASRIPGVDAVPTVRRLVEEELARADALDTASPPVSARQPLARESVAAAARDPARRLGRYVLIEELGRGGMGFVWRAFDPSLRREVAVKVIGGAGPVDERSVRRFAREARAAAGLRHPGIVAVHEVGEHDGRPFLVMDLVAGESLEAVIAAGPLPPRRAAEIGRDVADALEHAHRAGIVHRDVKPANVLIERSDTDEAGRGRPVLTDFGLAAERSGAERLTATGQLLGTPGYMAPEQVQAGAAPVGPAADVYALGGLLYHALAGAPAFRDESLVGLLRQVLAADPPPLRERGVVTHPDLETIVSRCLEKSPGRRYGSAAALGRDLDRFVRGEPIEARPPSRLGRAWRRLRRHRLAFALVGLLACAVLAVVGAVAWTTLALRRRVAHQRGALTESSRSRALDARGAFDEARSEPPVGPLTDEQRRDRQDRLLGLGLDALAASITQAALVGDEPTRRAAFDIALATGEVAIEAEQWGVARAAFDKALELEVDDALVGEAVTRGRRRREELAAGRRGDVEAIITAAREGAFTQDVDAFEDATFDLVRLAGGEAVALLAEALDEVGGRLRRAAADALRAAQPDAEERQLGHAPIAGLDSAVDRWLELDPRATLDPASAEVLAEAKRRIEQRDARRRASGSRAWANDALEVIGHEQARSIGPDDLVLARLCCAALGHLRTREGALDALGRYLASESSEERAIVAVLAVGRLGGDDELLERVVARFGPEGELAEHVARIKAW